MKTVLAGLALLVAAFATSTAGEPVPVLVELFTSEGCSSCPPADTWLSELARAQPVPGARVIALSLHVDYWNGLGWRDPFSSPGWTERQEAYVRRFGLRGAYTPQMVVDGRRELVGSDRDEALAAIREAAAAPKAQVTLIPRLEAGVLTVEIAVDAVPAGHGTTDVILALAENGLRSEVSRGENAGRSLAHDGVVRELRRIASGAPGRPFHGKAELAVGEGRTVESLDVVAFVQAQRDGAILGAALVPLAPESR